MNIDWERTAKPFGRNCSTITSTGSDGSKVVTFLFHLFRKVFHTEGLRLYYAHGPAGVTDWMESETAAKESYGEMARRVK